MHDIRHSLAYTCKSTDRSLLTFLKSCIQFLFPDSKVNAHCDEGSCEALILSMNFSLILSVDLMNLVRQFCAHVFCNFGIINQF